MSDARVKFVRIYDEHGEYDTPEPGYEQAFSFACPKHNRRCGDLIIAGRTTLKRDGQNQNEGVAQWDWTNAPDVTTPTFSPSINCGGCWHGYIRSGRCVDVQNNDEPERGEK
jgi:hypothetical protein